MALLEAESELTQECVCVLGVLGLRRPVVKHSGTILWQLEVQQLKKEGQREGVKMVEPEAGDYFCNLPVSQSIH